jgi:tripartite ATP-independent transporter DctM subunit
MSGTEIGLLSLGVILALVALRLPIAIVLLVVGGVGIAVTISTSTALSFLGSVPYEFAASWELSAVPMFLLMGALAFRSGLTDSLYAAVRSFIGFLPGGLALASNFACAVFAAASGSSVATAVAMGRIAVPEMLKSGYDKGLATAVCACAGTLGSLIPPSVIMILYGAFTGQSVAALFMAGVLPGILTAFAYALMIVLRCAVNPALAPRAKLELTRKQRLETIAAAWPIPLLIVGIVGSIYGGVATPTEAGAFGAGATCLIALLHRRLTGPVLRQSLLEALKGSAAIFLVGIGAVMLTRFMALSGVPDAVAQAVSQIGLGPLGLVVVIALIYMVLGCFLEPIGIMLLTLPVLVPALERSGVNLIWFGVLMVKYLEIGLITPPVGLNVFAIKSVAGPMVSLRDIFRGVRWFFVVEIVVTAILIAVPAISLFLPKAMNLGR